MRFVSEKGPVPLLGVEAETLGWYNGKKDVNVVSNLADLGMMDMELYKKQHTYHCKCSACATIGNKTLLPPQFKMQYDASLPKEGAEFISSPFPALMPIIDKVVDGLLVIGNDARDPSDGYTDIKGRPASAGLHIHASVQLQPSAVDKNVWDDAIRTFYLYYPEIFLLASSTGRRRYVHYRFPRYSHHDHHSFLIKSHGHLEWRVFEADLSDRNYLTGSMIVAACLTYLVQEPRILAMLESIGHRDRWDVELLDDMYAKNPADWLPEGSPIPIEYDDKVRSIVESNFDKRRMDALSNVLEELTYNMDVWKNLKEYLERAWAYAS